MKEPAWVQRIKTDLEAAVERTNNRKAAEQALREIAQFAETEADFIRDYELDA